MRYLSPRLSAWVSTAAVAALLCGSTFSAFAQDQGNSSDANGKVFLPLVSSSAQNTVAAESNQPFAGRTDQLIVRLQAGLQAAGLDRAGQVANLSAAAGLPLEFVREMSGDAIVLRLPRWMNAADASEIANRLNGVTDVAFAEPDMIMQPLATPNDPNYPQQWHYFSPTSGSYGANLPGAWDITTGSPSVVVAVIDTGILNHADLAGVTVPGYDFISDAQIGNDGNGRDSDPSDPGDWITSAESTGTFFSGCPVRNSSWHGSHVAGTIAGKSNNSLGVAGINWQSKVLPVRVLGKCGGYSSDIVDGIRWAAGIAVAGVPANANPAKVINMSLGGSGICSSSSSYQLAINDALSRGTVVAVAAGNSNADAAAYSPASCAGVITIASTGRSGNRAYYSNYGASVEIAAPGGDTSTGSTNGVLSTLNTGTTSPVADTYAYYQGTSMATPHVAGIVSLMFSVNPNLTPAQVTSLLQSTVTAFPAGSTCTTAICGPGIINAAAAVAAAQSAGATPPTAFAKSSPANAASVAGSSATLSWAASSGAASYDYCIDTTNDNLCGGSWISTGTGRSASVSGLVAGTSYFWQVRATNGYGTTEANSGTWWSFAVSSAPVPGAFNKTSPGNGATGVRSPATFKWGASSGATSYEICIGTAIGVCTWQNVGNVTQVKISNLAARTKYFWHVRSNNAGGQTQSNAGTWWSFTTR